MSDLISRQAAIDAVSKQLDRIHGTPDGAMEGVVKAWLENVSPAEPGWISIKWHDCTDEDREKYGFSKEIVCVFDCEMPDDEQEILVTTSHGYIEKDVNYIDDGFHLDSGWDWIEDIKAWMPLPKMYEEGESE